MSSKKCSAKREQTAGSASPEMRHRPLAAIFTQPDLTLPRSAFASKPVTTSEILLFQEIIGRSHSSQEASASAPRIIEIEDFSVYRHPGLKIRPHELVTLEHCQVEDGCDTLFLDATVAGRKHQALQRIPFSTVSVDGYYARVHSVQDQIYLQSHAGQSHNIWYRLRGPAQEYERYFAAYLWVADLAKHVIEYMSENELPVTLNDFKDRFYAWVCKAHGEAIKDWSSQHLSTDFRNAFAVHVGYIWKEAFSIDGSLTLPEHPVWAEIDVKRLQAIPNHVSAQPTTIVSPFVYGVFKDMYVKTVFETVHRSERQTAMVKSRRKKLGLTPIDVLETSSNKPKTRKQAEYRTGDVVAVKPDVTTRWKDSSSTSWYAYVQGVSRLKTTTRLDVIWLYRPCDTPIRHVSYPFGNEMFLSDNCSCRQDAIDVKSIIGTVKVMFGCNDPSKAARQTALFVRQTYMTDSKEFVAIKKEHFTCACQSIESSDEFKQARQLHAPGSFCLYRIGHWSDKTWIDEPLLEVAQIIEARPAQKCFLIRLLARTSKLSAQSQHVRSQNELWWTNEIIEMPQEYIVRPCSVATFASQNAVIHPYNRAGLGDHFYVIAGPDSKSSDCIEFMTLNKPLRGMSICCGGGNFDRGLEESGAVRFKHAIEIDQVALHTYRANCDDPDTVQCFLGPMEKYLKACMLGNRREFETADVDGIELIAAGCPCQSFSTMQKDRFSVRSVKNASLVPCLLSYVEHFMPTHFLLENVVGIATTPKGLSEDQNMFSAVMACLVGLGYQTQSLFLDAAAYLGGQSRKRVFVVATAPGFEPLSLPPQMSCRSSTVARKMTIGRTTNGEQFGCMQDELAPFSLQTIGSITADLPKINDGHTYTCISHPDHVVAHRLNTCLRTMIPMILRSPPGMGIAQALAAGKLSEHHVERFITRHNKVYDPKIDKAFSRVLAGRPIGTLTTTMRFMDRYIGRTLHWDQHRLLTVQEARRAQGMPDHEVLLGSTHQRWKVIGNSVHRGVAYSLGKALADSLKGAKVGGGEEKAPIVRVVIPR